MHKKAEDIEPVSTPCYLALKHNHYKESSTKTLGEKGKAAHAGLHIAEPHPETSTEEFSPQI